MKNKMNAIIRLPDSSLLMLIGLIGCSSTALAQAETVDSPATPPPLTNNVMSTISNAPAWSGPDAADGFDWVELTSGEWLKGEIKVMYDDKLEFDSDKLDLLKLDWEDVKQVITKRTHSVRNADKQEFAGSLRIDEKKVKVTTKSGETQIFPRSELLAIVPGVPKEINYWSFKLGLGATFQSGNTKQTDLNLSVNIKRQTTRNRFTLDYLGVRTSTSDIETANNHRINSAFDIFLTRRLFLRPVFVGYYRDQFQNIDHQGTVGIGMGYHLIDTSKTEWDLYGGPAYEYTKFTSVLPGEHSGVSTPALVAGTTFDTELTSWVDAEVNYQLSFVNHQSGTYKHHAMAGLSIELTSILDLDVSLVWDRIQDPQPRSDGSTPLPDDFRFLFGLGFDF